METALDRIITVDDCYVYVGKCCYELLRCELLELNVLGVLCDVCYCCVDACAILKLDDAFLCEEESSCFVCYVVGNCDDRVVGKCLKILCLTCINTERFIVDCTCRNES